ncbi:MAG TPA: hypothetical protein VF701_14705 [Thermoanaerobaculia bacterium]
MLSKSKWRATAVITALLALSCSRILPWGREPGPDHADVNIAFTMDRNLVRFEQATIDGREGTILLGSAAPVTVLDEAFSLPPGPNHTLQLRENRTLPLVPRRADLQGAADAIVGAEAWGGRALTIDYRSGLLTWQRQGIRTGLMTIFQYQNEPTIYVNVNGVDVPAIVDTTSPGTVVLPRRNSGRGTATITVAGTSFGTIDVLYADIPKARVGNLILSRFMVTIDYGRRVVGMWRDPRIPI